MIWLFITIMAIIGVVLSIPTMIGQLIYRSFSHNYDNTYYLKQIAIAADVTAGSIWYGSKHTISAITGKRSAQGQRYYIYQERLIDRLFYPGHCRMAAIHEGLIDEHS